MNLNDANEDLIDGGYDLSLRDGPTDQPELIAQPLIENRVVLCASPDYLARRGEAITLENYAQHDWLLLRHPLLNRSFWWVEHEGQTLRVRQPTPRLVSDNFDFCSPACSMAMACSSCPPVRRALSGQRATGGSVAGLLAGLECLRALGARAVPAPSAQHAQGAGVHRLAARATAQPGAVIGLRGAIVPPGHKSCAGCGDDPPRAAR